MKKHRDTVILVAKKILREVGLPLHHRGRSVVARVKAWEGGRGWGSSVGPQATPRR